MAKRKGRNKKFKKRKRQKFDESESDVRSPHSFVFGRGILSKPITELMIDVRRIFEPFTASNLQVKKSNVMKDFVSVASALSVTHMVVFVNSNHAVDMKLCRLPHGPTMTFRIKDFTSARNVRSAQKKPIMYEKLFTHQPLLVMNGFTGIKSTTADMSMRLKLCCSMWRNLFPAFDVNSVELNDIRRCILLNYNQDDASIDFRHYAIRIKPTGLSKVTRKIVDCKNKVPDLGNLRDITDLIGKTAAGSGTESEGEDEEFRQVTVCQKIPGNLINETSAVRLSEIGPRLTLKLFKIEEGLMEGNVLWSAQELVTSPDAS